METIRDFDISELPNSSFNLVLGKRRSGKSFMVENMVKRMIDSGDVHCCFLFSATGAGFDFIDDGSRFSDIDPLNNIVNTYKRFNEFNKCCNKSDQIRARSVVIIDDMAPMLKTKAFNILETLAVNGRHFSYAPCCLHFFILCQSLTKIPRVVRLNADNIFLNSIASSIERGLLFDENLYSLASDTKGKQEARQLYHDVVTSAPFCFLCIEAHRQNVATYADYLKRYIAE
jgi:hypothetical protein